MDARYWILVVLMTALLAGCGEQGSAETAKSHPRTPSKPKAQELEVTLDGYEGPESVGIVMAEERGYFADVGLDVGVYVALSPTRAVKYVSDRTVDIGLTHEPQLVLAKEKGAPIVAVGSVISRPTAAMIWLEKSNIGGIADLKGKTIAVPGARFQKIFLERILKRGGLTLREVKVKSVRYNLVPALVSGRADAIFGGSWNVEGAELKLRGLRPVITRVQSYGVPPYDELVLIARTDLVSEDSETIRDFMAAVSRGTAAAVEHPEAAIKAVEKTDEPNPDLTRKATGAQLDATLPLLSKSAYMSPLQAKHLVDWMHEQGMIQNKPPVSTLLTNDYVEPQ